MMSKLLAMTAALLILAVSVSAQVDQGAPDSIMMELVVLPDATTNQLKFQVDLFVFNDVNKLTALSCGFKWDNPNMVMDSARKSITSFFAFDQTFLYDASDIAVTNANKRFLFSGFTFGGKGLEPDPNRQHLVSYYFTLSEWSTTDKITLDTNEYDDGSEMLFIDFQNQDVYKPVWGGQHLIRDSAYSEPSSMILSTEALEFQMVQGADNPPPQTFDIASDNDPIDFTLSEDASWLLKSPSSTKTPSTVIVSINAFGLPAGLYIDTLQVNAPLAANSPQEVVITLLVDPPPAELNVSQTSFLFNGVVDGGAVAPQNFEITNSGGQDLNWSANSSVIWLTVDPTSGINDQIVSITVDVTGLAIGSYSAVVTVSDPNAANSPKNIDVLLSVASGLPEIIVIEDHNLVIIDLPPDDPDSAGQGPPLLEVPPVTIQILNAGGGTMNFTITESSSRLEATTPSFGTAPQEVIVDFKIPVSMAEGDYYDTLWIYSDEAENSPYPVEFHFYAQSFPATIFCNRSTLLLEVHECLNGTRQTLPTRTFFVGNIGADDPMPISLLYESELFEIDRDFGVAPSTFIVTPLDASLSVGTYYDTILVSAPKAINSPFQIVVQYEVLPSEEPPEIDVLLSVRGIQAVVQEDTGPIPHAGFDIRNLNFGCMEWHFEGSVPWAVPNITSGNVLADVDYTINPAGYEMGIHTDTILIVAPEAINSPQRLPMTLIVWRLRGDCNQDGKINLYDITYLIRYVYMSGPAPWPTLTVGDTDCDGNINLADITRVIDYVYLDGEVICGNPYAPADEKDSGLTFQ